jgi:hypothetical protein
MEWGDEEAAQRIHTPWPLADWVVWSGARPNGGPIAKTAAKAALVKSRKKRLALNY